MFGSCLSQDQSVKDKNTDVLLLHDLLLIYKESLITNNKDLTWRKVKITARKKLNIILKTLSRPDPRSAQNSPDQSRLVSTTIQDQSRVQISQQGSGPRADTVTSLPDPEVKSQ